LLGVLKNRSFIDIVAIILGTKFANNQSVAFCLKTGEVVLNSGRGVINLIHMHREHGVAERVCGKNSLRVVAHYSLPVLTPGRCIDHDQVR
jgi:hypothetical protein